MQFRLKETLNLIELLNYLLSPKSFDNESVNELQYKFSYYQIYYHIYYESYLMRKIQKQITEEK